MTGSEAEREQLRQGWRDAGVYPDLTMAQALEAGAGSHPDDVIVFASSDGTTERATLHRLLEAARRLARSLLSAGVRPGDAVALQCPCDRAGTELLEALWLLGAVVVPLTTASGTADIGRMIRDCGATTYVSPVSWRGVDYSARAVEHSADWGLERVLSLDTDAPAGAVSLRSVAPAPEPSWTRPCPAEVCCILYTSGSTAAAKGVQHSHETLLAGITAAGSPGGRSLMTFPAGHVAAMLGLIRPLWAGGTTVVMDRWSARQAVELIEDFGITASAGTPFFLSTLLDEADRTGRDISSLQTFLTGAASVPPALVERAGTYGIVSWRTYGSTEHPAISTGVPDDPVAKRVFTDGRVGPGNEVRLVDERGRSVPPGEEGEIVSRGPKQFLGYKDASLDEAAFLGTWFRTGDLGRFDPDGYLVVTDRLKDIVIRGGENISAREVEDALASHPAVAEVAVCAAPDETWGERVCAFVRPVAGAQPGLDQLAAHMVSNGLAPQKVLSELRLVEDFPRTAAGKIRKQDLRLLLRRQ